MCKDTLVTVFSIFAEVKGTLIIAMVIDYGRMIFPIHLFNMKSGIKLSGKGIGFHFVYPFFYVRRFH